MEEYQRRRKEFEDSLVQKKYGKLTFTEEENTANTLFRNLITEERADKHDTFFKVHTIGHRESFEKSLLFTALTKLPKGATLHLHTICCLDEDWFMEELAYEAHTYIHEEKQIFQYYSDSAKAASDGFKQLAQLRSESTNQSEFDAHIRSMLSVQESERRCTTNNIWAIFQRKIEALMGVLSYAENFKKYLKRMLLNFIADGVSHIESRTFLKSLTHADGTTLTVSEEMAVFKEVLAEINVDHPDFTLFIVVHALKAWSLEEIESCLKDTIQARKDYPDLIVGFDLVQEEDEFKSTYDTVPVLLKLKQFEQEAGVQLPLLLHGGESLDSMKNANLFDLLLLDTKRIGHGLNLSQHSYLLEKVKEQEICIEICPVSNQVLRYIDDIRMHPIKTFLNYGIKVCLNSDDPGFFGYNGVTMDFFFAAIGTELDYKDLKLCIYNSIQYSLLSEEKKAQSWKNTEKKLLEWVNWFIKRTEQIES